MYFVFFFVIKFNEIINYIDLIQYTKIISKLLEITNTRSLSKITITNIHSSIILISIYQNKLKLYSFQNHTNYNGTVWSLVENDRTRNVKPIPIGAFKRGLNIAGDR